jgi:hypothetical protein
VGDQEEERQRAALELKAKATSVIEVRLLMVISNPHCSELTQSKMQSKMFMFD